MNQLKKINSLIIISALLAVIMLLQNCDLNNRQNNDEECNDLCSLAKECYDTSRFDPEQCTMFCQIEEWPVKCLECRHIENCDDRIKCGYEYCDMRPSMENCISLCRRFETCADENLDIQSCAENCSTDRNMYECVRCLEFGECAEFIPCATDYCMKRKP